MPSLDPTTLGSTIFYVYSAPIRGKPLLDIPSHTLVFRMTINPWGVLPRDVLWLNDIPFGLRRTGNPLVFRWLTSNPAVYR